MLAGAVGIANASEPIVFGASLPLSGDNANEGRAMRGALELMMESVNKKGGISGRDLEIVFEDDQNKFQREKVFED